MSKADKTIQTLRTATDVPERQRTDQDEKVFVASQWQLMKWKFSRHKLAVASLVVIVIMYLAAAFAEFLSPYDPYAFQEEFVFAPPQRIRVWDDSGKFRGPFVYPLVKERDERTRRITYVEDRTRRLAIRFFVRGDEYRMWGLIPGDLHLFGLEDGVISLMGKDSLGRDVFSRILYGSRISLTIGLVGVAIGFFGSLLLGGLAGLLGGLFDLILMRITETLRSIPDLPLWIAFSAILPRHWTVVQTYFAITLILTLFGVLSGASRTVRGKFHALKEEDFVMAARLDGAGPIRLISRYLFPNFLSHQIADLTLSIPSMIIGETALSFIGLGLQAPAISWGVLLQEGKRITVLAHSPWLFIPAIYVVVIILALNFVGDGIRDAADPYAKV